MIADSPDHRLVLPPGRSLQRWLDPIRPGVPELTAPDWAGLELFEGALRGMIAHPSLGAVGQPDLGAVLLAVRRHLVQVVGRGEEHVAAREGRGEIGRVRDHALIMLGCADAQINSGLLAVLHTQRLAAAGHSAASLWARGTKAHSVDLARHATDELSVLIGAVGFTAEHHLQKARHDLDALRYADGMHDSLNRSAGRALLAASTTPTPHPTAHPYTEGPSADAAATQPSPDEPAGSRSDPRSLTITSHG
jgi:hypothetical protein